MSRSRRRARAWCWLASAAVSGSCTTPRTEVVVAVESDLTWGADGDVTSLVLDVRRGGAEGSVRFHRWIPLGEAGGRARLPYLVGLLPRDGDTQGSVWIQALACHRDGAECSPDDALVVQRAEVSWLPERTQLVRLLLSRRCVAFRSCPATQSCDPDEGRCVELSAVGRRSVLADDTVRLTLDAGAYDARPLDAATKDVAGDGPQVDAPRADTFVSDAPTRDVPTVDAPVIDAPVVDAPVIDAPVVDAPMIDAPVVDAPMIDAPVVDLPMIDAPVVDAPAVDASVDVPAVDAPVDAPAVDVPAGLTQRSCSTVTETGCGMAVIDGAMITLGGGARDTRSVPTQPGVSVERFAIDRHEVTTARFTRFWRARGDGGVTTPGTVAYRRGDATYALPIAGALVTDAQLTYHSSCGMNDPAALARRPIACVNWYTAQAFCVWDGGRLPTEAEWELAARGASGRPYPWGDAEVSASRGCWAEGDASTRDEPCDVGSFPMGATPDGVYDLAGGMLEFVADAFEEYRADGLGCWGGAAQRNPLCVGGAGRVVRSSSWGTGYAPYTHGWTRDERDVGEVHQELGFRCARSL